MNHTREAHHALFHPTSKRARLHRAKTNKKIKKKKNKKSRAGMLTTAERQAAARDKWHATHGPDYKSNPLRPLAQPRDIYADWPPNFDSVVTSPQPPTPTPTYTISPRKHKEQMRKLRQQRRGRFKKKRRRQRLQPAPQPHQQPQHKQNQPAKTIPPPTITPTAFPTPSNDIYNNEMRRLSSDLSQIPTTHTTTPSTST